MKLKTIFFSGLTMLMIGCSSTPSSTSYYLLNNQPSILQADSEDGAKESAEKNIKEKYERVIVLVVKDLPEYLEQSHLVMQMADHQLHYANFHMWAEPLRQGFKKALLSDLSSESINTKFLAYDREMNQDNLTQLFINIDFFHAMASSQVILSGQFWLSTLDQSNLSNQVNSQPFTFKLNLEKDGYPHSVEKMRMLVSKLAEQIIEKILLLKEMKLRAIHLRV